MYNSYEGNYLHFDTVHPIYICTVQYKQDIHTIPMIYTLHTNYLEPKTNSRIILIM